MDSATLQALFSGALGGLLVQLLNIWYTQRQARKALREERNGLLFLVDYEISWNDTLLMRFVTGDISIEFLAETMPPSTRVWDRSNVRLAQLLGAEEIKLLVEYYLTLNSVLNIVRDPDVTATAKTAVLKPLIVGEIPKSGRTARRLTQRYLRSQGYTEEIYDLLGSWNND